MILFFRFIIIKYKGNFSNSIFNSTSAIKIKINYNKNQQIYIELMEYILCLF